MDLHYVATGEDEGMELKKILKTKLSMSSNLIRRVKNHGGFSVNGEGVHVIHRLTEGDKIQVSLKFPEDDSIIAEDMEIDILFEDEALIVLNKQPGCVVHPTRGHPTSTLANGLKHHYLLSGIKADIHPVTRLDRETSGVIIFAKNPYIHNLIKMQMEERTVFKEYQGIVLGHPANTSGVINMPIGRKEGDGMLREITPLGRKSITSYRVLEKHKYTSLLNFVLGTGRTHQIRVHCNSKNHPILADSLYGDPMYENEHGLENIMDRQALHSSTVILKHPLTGKEFPIHAPLPGDMINALSLLKSL